MDKSQKEINPNTLKANTAKDWLKFDDLRIHEGLFKSGIIAVLPDDEFDGFEKRGSLNAHSFFIKERNFHVVPYQQPVEVKSVQQKKKKPSKPEYDSATLAESAEPLVTAVSSPHVRNTSNPIAIPVSPTSDRKFEAPQILMQNNKEDSVAFQKLPQPEGRFYKRAIALTKQIIGTSVKPKTRKRDNKISMADTDSVVFSPRHREEIFLPIQIPRLSNSRIERVEGDESSQALYIYPWISDNQTPYTQATGDRYFVTAGCLIGAKLQGINGNKDPKGLIKHHINFYPGERIEGIKFSADSPNPYETVIFEEFTKYIELIKGSSNPDQKNHIYYHLPYIDYLLFGIELFLRGRITPAALQKFTSIILAKRKEHQSILTDVCIKSDIDSLETFSPFDNLITDLNADAEDPNFIFTFLESLGYAGGQKVEIQEATTQQAVESEKKLVQVCLKRLCCDDQSNKDLTKTWQSLLKDVDLEKIDKLEDLFKFANTAAVASVTRNKKPYEVTSILPLTEKQIQNGYATYSKKNKIAQTAAVAEKPTEQPLDDFPAILNLTSLDPVLTYAAVTEGQLFYFPDCSKTIVDLVKNKHILRNAHFNTSSSSFFGKRDLSTVLRGEVSPERSRSMSTSSRSSITSRGSANSGSGDQVSSLNSIESLERDSDNNTISSSV